MKASAILLVVCLIGCLCTAGQSDTLIRPGVVLDGVYVGRSDVVEEEKLVDDAYHLQVQFTAQQPEWIFGARKSGNWLKDFSVIPGGSFIRGLSGTYLPGPTDTALLFFASMERDSVNTFLMGRHEVTNREYREFVHWVTDSLMRDWLAQHEIADYSVMTDNCDKGYLLRRKKEIDMEQEAIGRLISDEFYRCNQEKFYKQCELDVRKLNYRYSLPSCEEVPEVLAERIENQVNVYPDTTCWVREFPLGWMEPMQECYFWHPAYDDYPVVGVNDAQAWGYCHWKTGQLRGALSRLGVDPALVEAVRLPTVAEWEYAAVTLPVDSGSGVRHYPDEFQGKLLADYANLGASVDAHGVLVFRAGSDGYLLTAPVGSYPAGAWGLHDMAGNVAEWTAPDSVDVRGRAVAYPNNFRSSYLACTGVDIGPEDDVDAVVQKLIACNLPPAPHIPVAAYRALMDRAARILLHDSRVRAAAEGRRSGWMPLGTVKGGSWASPPVGLLFGLSALHPGETASAAIGFRVAVALDPERARVYFGIPD